MGKDNDNQLHLQSRCKKDFVLFIVLNNSGFFRNIKSIQKLSDVLVLHSRWLLNESGCNNYKNIL